MADYDLSPSDIKDNGGSLLYTEFDENGNRSTVHSRLVNKNQVVYLYGQLYSAYLKLWNDNRELKQQLDNKSSENNVGTPAYPAQDPIVGLINDLLNDCIDKRIKEKLCLYDDYYNAKLMYDGEELGDICIK